MAEEDQGTPERHASWIELFFDLVVVAGVAQLAHLLSHGPSLGDVGLYLLVFLAFWISWASFTVYGNVEGDRVRIPAMLLAMLGLAVMVAAVPGIRDQHTTAFVVAYVGLRWLAGAIYQRGQVVVDWPLAQYGGGAVPWLVSVFVSDSARYWLWTAGILIDLLAMMAFSGDNVLREAQRRLDRVLARRRLRRDQPMPILRAAHTESGHLSERMGLFVIIVLGEGVIQVLTATSEADWTLPLDAAAFGAFTVLTGLWTLSLLYGFCGVPGLEAARISIRHAMALNCATTAAIAALAAGLGAAIEHTGEHLPTGTRWLLCASVAAYFMVSAIGGLTAQAPARWLLGWALPCIVVPIALGFAGHLTAPWLIWALAATVGWQISYATVAARQQAAPAAA